MQRVLTALLLGGAAAFAPLPVAQRTLTLNASPIDIYSAAEDCLQEECSVDTVQMLVGQLKNREQELAKKGRIVAARVAIDAMPSQDDDSHAGRLRARGRARGRAHDDPRPRGPGPARGVLRTSRRRRRDPKRRPILTR